MSFFHHSGFNLIKFAVSGIIATSATVGAAIFYAGRDDKLRDDIEGTVPLAKEVITFVHGEKRMQEDPMDDSKSLLRIPSLGKMKSTADSVETDPMVSRLQFAFSFDLCLACCFLWCSWSSMPEWNDDSSNCSLLNIVLSIVYIYSLMVKKEIWILIYLYIYYLYLYMISIYLYIYIIYTYIYIYHIEGAVFTTIWCSMYEVQSVDSRNAEKEKTDSLLL